ncbi:MAG: hypothetical protein V2A76_18520 [Planctomycetota bacterium]
MKPLDVLLILVSVLFATGVIVDHSWGPERSRHRAIVRFQRHQLDLIAERLQEYHENTGRYPTTEEGLDVIPRLKADLHRREFAAARKFLKPIQDIRSIHGIPFVYENRNNAPPGAYRGSPAKGERDLKRVYSRKIGMGIYLSSIGLRQDSGRVFGGAWLDALLYFCGGVIVFLAIAYIVARNRKSGDRVRGINAMIMVGVAVLLALLIGISGTGNLTKLEETLPEEMGGYRSDLLQEYLALMKRFAEAGAIQPEYYQQLETRLRDEFRQAEERSGEPAIQNEDETEPDEETEGG